MILMGKWKNIEKLFHKEASTTRWNEKRGPKGAPRELSKSGGNFPTPIWGN